jgi:hypothetical protein
VISGEYQAVEIEVDGGCGMGVWSSDVWVAYSPAYFRELYAEPVVLEADGEVLEVPEPVASEIGPQQAWRMVPLTWSDSLFRREETYALTFCPRYQHTWSAIVIDEETIHVTREGHGCHAGDGRSRICDNTLSIEYVLAS